MVVRICNKLVGIGSEVEGEEKHGIGLDYLSCTTVLRYNIIVDVDLIWRAYDHLLISNIQVSSFLI